MGYANTNVKIGISPPKPARMGKNKRPAPIAVPERNVHVVSDLRQDDCFVWLDTMLSEVLISYPQRIN
ncbi:hypothetical protein ACLB1T_07450 [Escherichia coli]